MAGQKTTLWIFGVIQAGLGLFFVVGLLFRLQRWPGSATMIYSAITGFALVYLVKFFLKSNRVFQDYIRLALIITWLIRFVFKGLNLPYASIFHFVFLVIFVIWWLVEGPFYFFSPPGTKLSARGWLSRIAYNVASGAVVWAAYSRITGQPLPNLLMFGGMALLFVMLAIDFAGGRIQSQRKLAGNILFTVAGGSIMTGVYFRLAHYPYSEYLIGFGILIVGAWSVLEFMAPKNETQDSEENQDGNE